MRVIADITDRARFLVNRLRERLWVKPLAICLVSIGSVFAAKFAEGTRLREFAPEVSTESVDALLQVMASSMLAIATFAVASMVSAYASTSQTSTPRAFKLVIADDVSQNALSTFVGAFIFSIVALTASKEQYFQAAGRFALFVLTIVVFALVVLTFVRWVDRIARLGRTGTTIETVENAAFGALDRRRDRPTLGGVPAGDPPENARPVFSPKVGYVQHVDIAALQEAAEGAGARIHVAALPGTFTAPGQPLAFVAGAGSEVDEERVAGAFLIGKERRFDEDPRFGLVVLSEIAGRALSPAVNDPGTAIVVIGTLVRLFDCWAAPAAEDDSEAPPHDRVAVRELVVDDLFDDAFTAIARDGAGTIEVAIRLQKAFRALATLDDPAVRRAARKHATVALARSETAMTLPEELDALREVARFATADVTR